MHIYTTTFKVQPFGRGQQVHTFKGEAKDKYTAEDRAYEKLFAMYNEEELYVISHSTRATESCEYDRRDFQVKQIKQRH